MSFYNKTSFWILKQGPASYILFIRQSILYIEA